LSAGRFSYNKISGISSSFFTNLGGSVVFFFGREASIRLKATLAVGVDGGGGTWEEPSTSMAARGDPGSVARAHRSSDRFDSLNILNCLVILRINKSFRCCYYYYYENYYLFHIFLNEYIESSIETKDEHNQFSVGLSFHYEFSILNMDFTKFWMDRILRPVKIREGPRLIQ
jgi:hypothetical protein